MAEKKSDEVSWREYAVLTLVILTLSMTGLRVWSNFSNPKKFGAVFGIQAPTTNELRDRDRHLVVERLVSLQKKFYDTYDVWEKMEGEAQRLADEIRTESTTSKVEAYSGLKKQVHEEEKIVRDCRINFFDACEIASTFGYGSEASVLGYDRYRSYSRDDGLGRSYRGMPI